MVFQDLTNSASECGARSSQVPQKTDKPRQLRRPAKQREADSERSRTLPAKIVRGLKRQRDLVGCGVTDRPNKERWNAGGGACPRDRSVSISTASAPVSRNAADFAATVSSGEETERNFPRRTLSGILQAEQDRNGWSRRRVPRRAALGRDPRQIPR
jgi:hypothetical protein